MSDNDCLICSDTLREPLLFECCSANVCRTCMEKWVREGASKALTCVGCNKVLKGRKTRSAGSGLPPVDETRWTMPVKNKS